MFATSCTMETDGGTRMPAQSFSTMLLRQWKNKLSKILQKLW